MTDRRLIFGLAGAAALSFFAALAIGTTPIGPARFLPALFGAGSAGDQIVLWEIRAPRAAAAFLVGASLGLCGAALQGLLRNPLAEPGVLGVSASAALGATLSLYYGLAGLSALVLPLSAILGAGAATLLLAAAAVRISSVVTLILIGVGLSSFAGALMALLLNLAPNPFSLADLVNWSLGSVANRSFPDIGLAAPFLLAGAVLIFVVRRDLSVLTLGEEAAAGAGVDLRRTRLLLVLGTGLAAGAAVALAGANGFVGIVAPHLVRPFVDHAPARVLAPAALAGGVILILADIAVRLLPTPAELKLGVVAALIGAPAFIAIAMQRRAVHD